MNASVYVYDREFLLSTDTVHGDSTTVSVMPRERSVDIDEPIDLQFVNFLMESNDD
jgi:CMP-N-acetylneuraminic acid synthetase